MYGTITYVFAVSILISGALFPQSFLSIQWIKVYKYEGLNWYGDCEYNEQITSSSS